MFKSLKKSMIKTGTFATGLFVSASVFATENAVDYSALTSKIDFSAAMQAVLSVIALIVGALVTWKGAQWIVRAIKGA